MSDGWTGINIGEVKNNLNEFKDGMESARELYFNSLIAFNVVLYRGWASERAVEFNTRLEKLAELNRTIRNYTEEMLHNAQMAGFYMAASNGANFDYDYFMNIIDTNYKPLAEEQDGVKGMNIPLVKDASVTFMANVGKVNAQLAAIPYNIALIDPSGELQAIYEEKVKKLAGDITEQLLYVVDELNEAFEQEELQLQMGKAQAEDALGGGASEGINILNDIMQEQQKHIYN